MICDCSSFSRFKKVLVLDHRLFMVGDCSGVSYWCTTWWIICNYTVELAVTVKPHLWVYLPCLCDCYIIESWEVTCKCFNYFTCFYVLKLSFFILVHTSNFCQLRYRQYDKTYMCHGCLNLLYCFDLSIAITGWSTTLYMYMGEC